MSLRVKVEDLPAAAYAIVSPHLPSGVARHQLAFSGSTGTVLVEINAGVGYQSIKTIDLTDATRLPFTFECEVQAIRVSPSVVVDMAYSAQEIG
jgi:hypothetical protein